MGGEGRSVVLDAREKRERRYGDDRALMMDLSVLLVGLDASAAPAASEGVTVGTELANFFCQPRCEASVYF